MKGKEVAPVEDPGVLEVIMIKQCESEIGSDMLLVSESFHTSNIMSIEFESRNL